MDTALSVVLQNTTLDALAATGSHDAIVIGAGAAGGLAAMLLAESGLRVLVLDAGLPRSRLQAPLRKLLGRLSSLLSTTEGLKFFPPGLVPAARAGAMLLGKRRQPIQSQCMTWMMSPNSFVDDYDCPYVTPTDHPFLWVRVRMLGGRVAVPGHGRQYYRLGPDDFNPPDGLSPPWPLKPGELDPWYASVERRLKLSGMRDNIPGLSDSELTDYLTLTENEIELRDKILARWPSVRAVAGRYSPPLDSLERAAQTGRLQCRQGAIAHQVRVDNSGNVCGVMWIDHQSGRKCKSSAPLVFLCASALESTRILLLSHSRRGTEGLGTSSGSLGSYLMDHVLVSADGTGHFHSSTLGQRSNRCLYLPRFDAREANLPSYRRGYGVQVYEFAGPAGQTHFAALSFGEMIPRRENRVTVDPFRRDKWGIPILRIHCAYSDTEFACARDQTQGLRELAALAHVNITRINETPAPPGSSYHECGTARMGTDPSNSVLDPHNQCWDARGLYVTDGACFPSQGTQNPTLTILALTARACSHAVNNMPQGRLRRKGAPFIDK